MQVISVRNVNHALRQGLALLAMEGRKAPSRAGTVYVARGPVTTYYGEPRERVLFDPRRDANPFFHFFEALWMLDGRQDVATLEPFNSRMRTFSDDGRTLHGAYGRRWRHHFRVDQLTKAVDVLRREPESRRVVVAMWDPSHDDMAGSGRDLPCNTHVYLSRRLDAPGGPLDMTVCCRSNDIIWGAYGANVVHFSMLQELVAAGVGCPVGTYHQVSNNYHAYEPVFAPLWGQLGPDPVVADPYETDAVAPYDLCTTPLDQWLQDLRIFLSEGPIIGLRDRFFRRVATPMWHAHAAYSDRADRDRLDKAQEIIAQCQATDWRLACSAWLERRRARAMEKSDAHD